MTPATKAVRITSETHTHQDKPVTKGTVLSLDVPTADHLIEIGAAEAVASTGGEK